MGKTGDELTALPMFALVRKCGDDGHLFATLAETGWSREEAESKNEFAPSDSYSLNNPVVAIWPVTVTITVR
jgi:hypothetical protein